MLTGKASAVPSGIGQFLRLYRDGTYRDADIWGFNRLAMLKDAMFGLLLRRFVFRSNQDVA